MNVMATPVLDEELHLSTLPVARFEEDAEETWEGGGGDEEWSEEDDEWEDEEEWDEDEDEWDEEEEDWSEEEEWEGEEA